MADSQEENSENQSTSNNVFNIPSAPGDLEVAEMKESLELKERRDQMKRKIQESATTTNEENFDASPPLLEVEGGLMSLLQEAGLSRRHLTFCCSGLLFLGVIVGAVFGVRTFLEREVGPDVEPPQETEDSSVVSHSLRGDPSLDAAFLLSRYNDDLDPSLSVGEDLSQAFVAHDQFSLFVFELREHVNSLEVNVNELLNNSGERRRALRNYSENLGFLERRTEQNRESLLIQIDFLKVRLNEVQDEADGLENRFFELESELDAAQTSGALRTFIEASQRVVEVRATLRAYQDLLDQTDSVLEYSQIRRRDIELNEEALVKGVRVVEVEGSDLNLIIPEAEL